MLFTGECTEYKAKRIAIFCMHHTFAVNLESDTARGAMCAFVQTLLFARRSWPGEYDAVIDVSNRERCIKLNMLILCEHLCKETSGIADKYTARDHAIAITGYEVVSIGRNKTQPAKKFINKCGCGEGVNREYEAQVFALFNMEPKGSLAKSRPHVS